MVHGCFAAPIPTAASFWRCFYTVLADGGRNGTFLCRVAI